MLNETGDYCFRKQSCATTCLKECDTYGWSAEELSVVLGTKTRILCQVSSQSFLSFELTNNVMKFLVVSSMRTGPAMICMAFKRVWIIWNKSSGKNWKQESRRSCYSWVCQIPLMVSWYCVFQAMHIWSQPNRRACEIVRQFAYWRGWIYKNMNVFYTLFLMHLWRCILLLIFTGMSHSSILCASLGAQPILHFPVGQHHPVVCW